jgi:hypothetical protein
MAKLPDALTGVNMLDPTPLLTADAVLERTRSGQCETLSQSSRLSAQERRLLAILTGFTSLGDLLALLGETEVPQAVLAKLMDEGLVRVAVPKRKAPPSPALWTKNRHGQVNKGR